LSEWLGLGNEAKEFLMNELQKKALQQAIAELDVLYMLLLQHAAKPDFGDPSRRDTKAGEAVHKLYAAKDWIAATLKA
jgi:hypothetical protein